MRAVADGELDYELEHPADRADEFGELARELPGDEPTARRARQAEGRVRLRRVARAQDADQRDHRLPAAARRRRLRPPDAASSSGIHKTLGVQANTLLRLVKQLLDVSRFEAGGGRLEPRPVRAATRCSKSSRAPSTSSPFSARSSFDVDGARRIARRSVLGSRSHQRGARQPAVERVQVHAARRLGRADASPSDGGVRMEVRDTGAGIPAEQLPHIFEKFYQADNQGSASRSRAQAWDLRLQSRSSRPTEARFRARANPVSGRRSRLRCQSTPRRRAAVHARARER